MLNKNGDYLVSVGSVGGDGSVGQSVRADLRLLRGVDSRHLRGRSRHPPRDSRQGLQKLPLQEGMCAANINTK